MENQGTQYQVLFKTGNGMTGIHFIQSENDLVESYKNHLIMGDEKILAWEKGVLRMSEILGVYRL